MFGSAKPWKMWIDGKCFNIKNITKLKKSKNEMQQSPLKEECPPSSIMNHNFNIISTDSGNLATSFRLPSIYYIRLNNPKLYKLSGLQSSTNTIISIPKHGDDGNIMVYGDNEANLVEAREALHSFVWEIREKEKALQFISIPVHTEEVQRNFLKFKEEILNGDPIEGMDETIFISPLKLHLTVVVFALMDTFEKTEAIEALNDCKKDFLDPFIAERGPLKIKVAGINCMNNNLKKVNILYADAKIEHETQEDILQRLVNGISDYFYERGLVRQYKDNVKLHVTLMNTRYKKLSTQTSPYNKRSKWQYKKETFDATTIMEKYKDYYFGESIVDSIHLSCMSTIGDDGFYKPLAIIKFEDVIKQLVVQ